MANISLKQDDGVSSAIIVPNSTGTEASELQ